MRHIEIVSEYFNKKITLSNALAEMNKLCESAYDSDNKSLAFKISFCATLLKRTEQFNRNVISSSDYLMFVRDFVLYVGKIKLPVYIVESLKQNVKRLDYGITFDENNIVDIIFDLPKWFKTGSNLKFVKRTYNLNLDDKKNDFNGRDNLLLSTTKHLAYRSLEQQIAAHISMKMKDDYTMLLSLPTGGGKSLITQLIGSKAQKLTLVVVPTVVLAHDQYLQVLKTLKNEEIIKGTFCYRGEMEIAEKNRMFSALEEKTATIIFTSPEAIMKNQKFNDLLRQAAEEKYLSNIVVDEAHIVPEWGIYFRPDFQIFSVFVKELRELAQHSIRTYLLSATLEDEVVDVLFSLFGNEDKNISVRCDALRREPAYVYYDVKDYNMRKERVIEIAQFLPKPAVIYVYSPEEAQSFYDLFRAKGFKNIFTYTGKTSDQERSSILNAWKANEIDIVIGTSAFGIGVDKSNVRTIIHACIPENISRFYQEVGRAGRDGLASLSVFIPHTGIGDNDLSKANGLISGQILTTKKMLPRWKGLLKNADIKRNKITVNLSAPPEGLTFEEAENVGKLNLNWNVSMLLLMNRQKLINITNVIFTDLTYYFVFDVLDLEIIYNDNYFINCLEEHREIEAERQKHGYQEMAGLIHNVYDGCWGERLQSIFPLAEVFCSGCPYHSEPYFNADGNLKIRECKGLSFEYDNSALDYLMAYEDTLVITGCHEQEINNVIADLDKLKLSCIVVMQQHNNISISTDALLIKVEEFIGIAEIAPEIFYNGIGIVFGNNHYENNRVYETLMAPNLQSYKKILCCEEDMFIDKESRKIRDFLNAPVIEYDEVMEM